MTNQRLIENKIRRIVKRVLSEGKKDIRKIDRSNLAGTAEEILDAFISVGATGTYDPETTKGQVSIAGTQIEFFTGQERVHLSIENISSLDPKHTISSLKKFLRDVADYG